MKPGHDSILPHIVRYAQVLHTALDGQCDIYMISGSSARVRDTRSGYFWFVINEAKDIQALTKDVSGLFRYFIAIDAQYEEIWRELFPDMEFKRFKMSACTRNMFAPTAGKPLPDGMRINRLDASWEDLVTALCADEEFTADLLIRQIRENLSLGLIWKGKRMGFLSRHLSGELGPVWIAEEARGRGFATLLIQEYMSEYFKENTICFAITETDSIAARRVLEKTGFITLEADALHASAGNRGGSSGE